MYPLNYLTKIKHKKRIQHNFPNSLNSKHRINNIYKINGVSLPTSLKLNIYKQQLEINWNKSKIFKAHTITEEPKTKHAFGPLECLGRSFSLKPEPDQPGADQSEPDQSGADQSGADQSGAEQSEPDQSGADQSGADRSEPDQSGADQSGADRSEPDQSGADQSGTDRSEPDQSGADRSEPDQSGSLLSWVQATPSPAQTHSEIHTSTNLRCQTIYKYFFPVIIVYYEMLFNILYIWPNPKCRFKNNLKPDL